MPSLGGMTGEHARLPVVLEIPHHDPSVDITRRQESLVGR
jgi:hypothetical protein